MDYMNMHCILNFTCFGITKLTSITRTVHLMEMNLSGKARTLEMVIAICGIINIYFLSTRFLVLYHVELHEMFLVLVQLRVLGLT